jgi:nitrogen fixation NifU-like protein
MFEELRDIYQEVILDHGKKPRNFHRIDDPTCLAHGNNPVCGDTLVIYLNLNKKEEILEVSFQGQGCAISVASASMMTEILKGKTILEAKRLFEGFHDMCTKDDFDIKQLSDCDEEALERLSLNQNCHN